MELDGTTTLVTGANRGIGRAIALELADRGAHVLAGVRALDGAHELPARPNVERVRIDLSSREAVDSSLRELDGRGGTVELLVNNAGIYEGGLLEEQDPAAIYDLVQADLIAPMHLTRALLPPMLARGAGKVVNNVSIIGYAQFPGSTTYGAAKAGLAGFSDALRRELDATGVDVLHLVTPGVDTEMMDEVQEAYDGRADASGWGHVQPEEWAEKVADAIEDDEQELGPGGPESLAKLASRGPAKLIDLAARRIFTR